MQAMNSHFLEVPLCDLTDYIGSIEEMTVNFYRRLYLVNHFRAQKHPCQNFPETITLLPSTFIIYLIYLLICTGQYMCGVHSKKKTKQPDILLPSTQYTKSKKTKRNLPRQRDPTRH